MAANEPLERRIRAENRVRIGFWALMFPLILAETTCALESSMVMVALSHLYGVYGNPAYVGWLITAFTLTSAASAAICGRLGDLYGRVRVLTCMLVLALAGSLTAWCAPNLTVVMVGRALQGASMAVLPLALGILKQYAPSDKVNVGIGVLAGTYTFASGVGVILGGAIIDHFQWQSIFLASIAAGLLALGCVFILLPTDTIRRKSKDVDLIGGVLFVIPIVSLLLGLNAIQAGWGGLWTAILLAAGVIGIASWVKFELRQPNPLIDIRQLGKREIAALNAAVFFTAAGPIVYAQVILPLLQQPAWTGVGFGLTATVMGIVKFPTNITGALAGVGAGYLAQRITLERVVILAGFISLASWLLLTLKHDSAVFILIMLMIFVVPSLSILSACTPGLVMAAAPEDRASEATGMAQVMRSLGMSVGSQVLGLTLARTSTNAKAGGEFPDASAYHAGLCVISGTCILTLIFLMLARSARIKEKDNKR